MSLVERLRRARETWATVGGFDFLIRRPTALEGAELRDRGRAAQLAACVVDWRGVKESDLVPGGAGDAVPFDAEVFVEWVSDRPELLAGITQAITDAIRAHQEKREALAKN